MGYRIKNISFEYMPGKPVLFIGDLDINKAQIIFIIGRSGIGKSTFIEALGMMNNIAQPQAEKDSCFHYFNSSGNSIDLWELWDSGHRMLSQFRASTLSFMFQNTNLLPHYSAGDNLAIASMISGVAYPEAKDRVLSLFREVALDEGSSELLELYDRSVLNFSGGQKQRLAFIRAILSEHDFLFGDEPTGNLDPVNSKKVMDLLRFHVSRDSKTAVIVSHDYSLAREYADRIIPILPLKYTTDSHEEAIIGYIDNTFSFVRKENDNWVNEVSGSPVDFEQIIDQTEKNISFEEIGAL